MPRAAARGLPFGGAVGFSCNAAEAAAAAGGLQADGVQRVYLAGRPADYEDDLRASGVAGLIPAGIDLVVLLSQGLDDRGAVA